MNDCFWFGIGVCNGVFCNCAKYTSIGSEEGNLFSCAYDMEIQSTLEPVKEKWRNFWHYDFRKINGGIND